MFGFGKKENVSITNLGKVTNPRVENAYFIPPHSPSARKMIGVLTVNDRMNLVISER